MAARVPVSVASEADAVALPAAVTMLTGTSAVSVSYVSALSSNRSACGAPVSNTRRTSPDASRDESPCGDAEMVKRVLPLVNVRWDIPG